MDEGRGLNVPPAAWVAARFGSNNPFIIEEQHMTVLRKPAVALAATCLALGAVVALPGAAHADTYTSGHFDLVFIPECDLSGDVVDGFFEIEGVGSDPSPVFDFTSNGPDLGFEVEWDDDLCDEVNVTVALTGSTGPGSGTSVDGPSSTFEWDGTSVIDAGALLLEANNGYHEDPNWTVDGTSSLEFTFTPDGGPGFVSTEPLTVTG